MNKKISIVVSFFLLMFFLGSAVFYQSCKKDPCKKVFCANNGTCKDGTCTCPTGYEGSDCVALSRDKFVGTYEVNEDCANTTAAVYNISVSTLQSDISKVLIYNFNKRWSVPVFATVDKNTITIASQQPNNDGVSVVGSGTISADGKTVTMSYTITGSTSDDVCSSSVWIK